MKLTKKIYGLVLAASVGIAFSCKDDSLELIPEWESAVHAQAAVTTSNTDFLYNTPTAPIGVDLSWISIDGKASVTKMEVYVVFDENYVDKDGNPAVAKHGGAKGRLFKTFEGGAVPANRTPVNFSLSQAELYALYSNATFNYDGNGSISVFSNPDKPERDAAHRFMWDDQLSIRWEFTTDDGRLFEKWGVSVCTEFPNSDCSVDFTVVCATEIEEPAGTWKFDMVDTYGDGWQGGYIAVIVDGVKVEEINIPSQYDPGGVPASARYEEWTFPGTGSTLEFEWSDDDYNSECEFTITSPKGNVVAKVSGPSEGPIKLDLCKE